jgi:hypothetical protein
MDSWTRPESLTPWDLRKSMSVSRHHTSFYVRLSTIVGQSMAHRLRFPDMHDQGTTWSGPGRRRCMSCANCDDGYGVNTQRLNDHSRRDVF